MDVRYEITGAAERNVFFDVRHGRDRASGDRVQVHVLRESCGLSPERLEALAAQAAGLRSLAHPHIVSVRAAVCQGGQLTVATDEPQGAPLTERLVRGPLSPYEAVRIGTHLCEALAYAHERGLVHGALRPECIYAGAEDDVQVGDFGTWGLLAATAETTAFVRRYRAAYISPEEARGQVPTEASDVYSLGVILYRALAGRLPFQSANPLELARAHVASAPAPLSAAAPTVPPALERAVLLTLEKDPARRFGSARELLKELRQLGRQLQPPPEPPPPPPVAAPREEPLPPREAVLSLGRVVGRSVLWLTATVGVTLGAFALVFFWLLYTHRAEVVVPDTTGMTVQEATAAAARRGLKLVPVLEEYTADVPAGRIVRMITPYPDKRVGQGRELRVVVSKGVRKLLVPDVTDLPREDATKMIARAKLKLGTVTEAEDELVPAKHVIRQTPGAGERVPEGTVVSLTVSKGPKEKPKRDPNEVYPYVVVVRVPKDSPELRQVRIDIEDPDGSMRTVYSQWQAGGEEVRETVAGRGAYKIQVYLDDELVREVKTGEE